MHNTQHLMGALGTSFFKGEFYCNDPADFVYEGVLDSCRSGLVGAPLTEAEEARAAEQKATIGQDIEQAGMSALPFQLTGQALEKLAELNTGAINFVELKVDAAEQVDLVSAKSLASPDEISGSMDASNGRFYALRFEEKLFFVLSCPEATPIKDRMILATVTATVLEACTQAGLSFTKMVEVQDPADVTSDLVAEIQALTEDRSVKNDLAFSKPKGPPRRRGKRRMIKK